MSRALFKYGLSLTILFVVHVNGLENLGTADEILKDVSENKQIQNADAELRVKRFLPPLQNIHVYPPVYGVYQFTNAMAVLQPKDDVNMVITGEVNMTQFLGEPIALSANLSGLEPGVYSFHVNEFGDLSEGCDSTGTFYPLDWTPGPHFAPHQTPFHRGAPNFFGASHLGDFRVTESDGDEMSVQTGPVPYGPVTLSLTGHAGRGRVVAGRSLALYRRNAEDDVPTNRPWNPADLYELVACGVIAIVN